MKTTNLIPPNTEYLELNFVGETATGRGNNQQYVMENLHDGTFRGTESRVGITIGRHRPRSFINPMEKWDEIFQSKVSRGYMVTKTKKMEQKVIEKNTSSINGNEYAPIANASVNEVVTLLLECTTAVLSQNYRIKIDDISDEMIAFGQSILKELSSGYSRMSVAEFNNKLKTLYAAIPRRIDNLSKVLAKRKLDFNDIIADEQELFDVMVNRVRNAHDLDNCSVRPTVLEAFHLDCRVQRIGSMFGNGTYFAPLAQKSLGYTDGGYWAGGNTDVRFLAIYRVATGKHYDIYHGSDSSLTKAVLQKKCPGAHCVWAHGRGTGGTTLLNDEVVVYDEAQSTIEYLIMMK